MTSIVPALTHSVYFHCQREKHLTVMCVAEKTTPKRVCWAFIDEVIQECNDLSIAPSKDSVMAILKRLFKKWENPNADQLLYLNSQVDELKVIMVENIEKLLDRGEKLSSLVVETEHIAREGEEFRTGGHVVRNRMVCRVLFLVGILLSIFGCTCFAILGIVMIVCNGKCLPPK
jgi:vesicle-associated membrane protein 7